MSKISIVTIAKEIKEIHPNDIVLIKSGNFYKVYGKDAYIISNLFKYTVKEDESSKTYVKNSKRIEAIYEYLLKNAEDENLKNILKGFEDIINAKR